MYFSASGFSRNSAMSLTMPLMAPPYMNEISIFILVRQAHEKNVDYDRTIKGDVWSRCVKKVTGHCKKGGSDPLLLL